MSRSFLILFHACAVESASLSDVPEHWTSDVPEHLALLQTRAVSSSAATAEELLLGASSAESEAEAQGSRSQAVSEAGEGWLNVQHVLNGVLRNKKLAAQPVSTEVVFTNRLLTVPERQGSQELKDLVNATGLMEFGNETMEIEQTVTMNSRGTGWALQREHGQEIAEELADAETALGGGGLLGREAANWTRSSTGAVDLSSVTASAIQRKLHRIVEDSELVRDAFEGVKLEGSSTHRKHEDAESEQQASSDRVEREQEDVEPGHRASTNRILTQRTQDDTESEHQSSTIRRDEHAATPSSLAPLAFVKTHRTGGSTLANIVHRLGEKHNMSFLLPSGEHDKNSLGWPGPFPGADVANLLGQSVHRYDVICNNAVFDEKSMRRYLRPSPFFFTILRRPENQIESAFDFFKPPCGPSFADRLTWLQDLRGQSHSSSDAPRKATLRAAFVNPQAHDLGWYQRTSHGQDDESIHEWLAEVGEAFNLVLLAEYFDEGLVLFKRRLNLDLDDVVHLDMKRESREDDQRTPRQAAELKETLHVDDMLYNHFNRTFWRAWEREGGDAALRDEVDELRRRNAALRKDCEKGGDACPWSLRADSAEYTEHLRAAQARSLA